MRSLARIIALTLLELLLLVIFRWLYKGLFFSQAIFFLIFTSIILYLGVFLGLKFNKFDKVKFEVYTLIIMASLGFSLFFVGVVPTMADRSISVFLLASVEKGNVEPGNLLDKVGFGYMDKSEMERRINEQLVLGNVELIQGRYKLTPRGIFFAKLDKLMATIYQLNPQYSSGVK